MNILEEIYGFVNLDNIEYSFFFSQSDYKITLFPPDKDKWLRDKNFTFLVMGLQPIKHEWIESIKLEGFTAEGFSIIFYVSNDPYVNNGFRSYTVFWVVYHSGKFDFNQINGLRLTGGDIDRFFPAEQVLQTRVKRDDKMFIEELNVSSKRIDYYPCGKYRIIKNVDAIMEVTAFATIHLNNNEKPISSNSLVRIEYSSGVSVDTVIKTIRHLHQFFYYSFYRSNIMIPDIELFWWDDNKKRNYSGRVLLNGCPDLDNNKKAKDSVVKYDFWKTNMSKMITDIKNNKIELNHICESVDKRKSYPPARFFSILATFEREYRNIYGVDKLRSEKYLEEKNAVINLINDYAKSVTGKKKKYIKGFADGIFNLDDSYKDRVLYSLIDCKDIMEPFISFNYNGSYNDVVDGIAFRVGIMRNGFAHSKLDFKVDPINISDIQIIEILLYAMRMKKYSKDTLLIQKSIAELFCLNMGF